MSYLIFRQLPVAAVLFFCAPVLWADHPSLNLDTGAAGPVATLPAHTLPQDRTLISLSVQYLNNDEIGDAALKAAAGRHEHVHSTASVMETALSGAWGMTDDLTLGFRMPYVNRRDLREGEHHHGGSGDRVAALGDADGRGDLNVFGQYRFFRSDSGRYSAALLLGLRAPTGTTSEINDAGEKFAVDHQPGSGGWGGLFGVSWSTNVGVYSIDSNVLYTLSTAGKRDTNIGDAVNYNLSVSRMLYTPEEPHHHDHVHDHEHHRGWLRSVDAVLELNGEWRDRVEMGGVDEEHTGGNVVYLSPGVRSSFAGGWSAHASVGVPVIENLNGQQSEPEYRVLAGISKVF